MGTTKIQPRTSASKKRQPKTPFVISADGSKFVELTAVMSPLVAMVDGVPLSQFKGDRKYYLRLANAISWIGKEMTHHTGEAHAAYTAALGVLIQFRDQADDPAKDAAETPPPSSHP